MDEPIKEETVKDICFNFAYDIREVLEDSSISDVILALSNFYFKKEKGFSLFLDSLKNLRDFESYVDISLEALKNSFLKNEKKYSEKIFEKNYFISDKYLEEKIERIKEDRSKGKYGADGGWRCYLSPEDVAKKERDIEIESLNRQKMKLFYLRERRSLEDFIFDL